MSSPTPSARVPSPVLRCLVAVVCGLALVVTVLPAVAGAAAAAAEAGEAGKPGEAGEPGELDSSEITLAGTGAESLAPATGMAARARSGDSLEPTPGVVAEQTPDDARPRRTTAPAERGWSATVDIADGSEMVAFSWAGDRGAGGQGAVLLRSQSARTWSEWSELAANPAEGPDEGGNARSGVGPVWLGSEGAERIEIVVSQGPLVELDLLAMRWNEPARARSNAGPAGPGIRPRSDWADSDQDYDCEGGPRVMDDLRFAVVHHTATSNDYTRSQVPGILQGIYRYHAVTRGWCDVAYNFLIDRFGTVWQGRAGDIAKPIGGGHAAGFNLYSVGVALLGDHRFTPVPWVQEEALGDLLAWKLNLHGIDPHGTTDEVAGRGSKFEYGEEVELGTIIGHRDTGQTSCPGYHAYGRLDEVRDRVDALIEAADQSRWGPFENPGPLVSRQYEDLLGRAPTEGEIAAATSTLVRDALPPSAWIANLSGSGEADGVVAPVLRLYDAYFDRFPDHDGLAYWVERRRDDADIAAISEYFAESGEFRATYGSLSDRDFVELVYENVLGRASDQGGADFWTGELGEGERSRGSLMAGFVASPEYVSRNRLANQLIMVWEGMLGREPSEALIADWVGRIRDDATMAAYVEMILVSPEYESRV